MEPKLSFYFTRMPKKLLFNYENTSFSSFSKCVLIKTDAFEYLQKKNNNKMNNKTLLTKSINFISCSCFTKKKTTGTILFFILFLANLIR